MDVIKTSLIIAIGITFYYLLLQWPVDSPNNDKAYSEDIIVNTISDSEPLLSQPLEPLSSLGESKEEVVSCLLYTSPSPRDGLLSRMPSSA